VEIKLLFFSFFLLLWNGGHLILTHFNFSFFCHIWFTGPAVGRQAEGRFLGWSKKTKKKTYYGYCYKDGDYYQTAGNGRGN